MWKCYINAWRKSMIAFLFLSAPTDAQPTALSQITRCILSSAKSSVIGRLTLASYNNGDRSWLTAFRGFFPHLSPMNSIALEERVSNKSPRRAPRLSSRRQENLSKLSYDENFYLTPKFSAKRTRFFELTTCFCLPARCRLARFDSRRDVVEVVTAMLESFRKKVLVFMINVFIGGNFRQTAAERALSNGIFFSAGWWCGRETSRSAVRLSCSMNNCRLRGLVTRNVSVEDAAARRLLLTSRSIKSALSYWLVVAIIMPQYVMRRWTVWFIRSPLCDSRLANP